MRRYNTVAACNRFATLSLRKVEMRRFLQISGIVLLVFLGLVVGFFMYVKSVSTLQAPDLQDKGLMSLKAEHRSHTDRRLGESFLVLNPDGNWEMYLEGNAFRRGVVHGKLAEDLLYVQEKHFIDQIRELVPNESYLRFLKYLVGFFNRNMSKHVINEYQQEIYGVAMHMPDTFDFVSQKYDRAMNYHAAHDIGHALQNLALVGCTSFATEDEDGQLVVGRNFDFYVGDGFAENKIVALVKPDSGYAFLSVTWPGMIGVVSGMNQAGLTITLNAAPSEVPTSSATPISILAREILQYAATIDEALAIAKKRQTFVSESLLIASARDDAAAIIEKTPHEAHLFRPETFPLVCSNHFQSDALRDTELNQTWKETSDSPYRYKLMHSLLDTASLHAEDLAEVLRHKGGVGGESLGLGNPMAINQLIAHHGVIFKPSAGMAWVSSSPWQMGAFTAYDLNAIFGEIAPQPGVSMSVDSLRIAPHPWVHTPAMQDFERFRSWATFMQQILRKRELLEDEQTLDDYIALNPDYYLGYALVGEYWLQRGEPQKARTYLEKALRKPLPYASVKRDLNDLLDQAQR